MMDKTTEGAEKIEYVKVNGYRIPKLEVPPPPEIGKWGRMRLKYLKEHKRALYREMLTEGTLNEHLETVDRDAREMLDDLITRMAERDGVNEELKARDQMEWVRQMNNIRNSAEEAVMHYKIYPEANRD